MRYLVSTLGACWLLTAGCGSDSQKSIVSPSSAPAAFKACGGDPTGNWNVESLTVTNIGESAIGIDVSETPECAGALMSAHATADGNYTFRNGNYTSDANVTLDLDLHLSRRCFAALANSKGGVLAHLTASMLQVNPELCSALESALSMQSDAFATAACGLNGDACDCSLSTPKTMFESEAQGAYSVEGNQLTYDGDQDSFCVQGNELQIQSVDETTHSAAVLVLVRSE